MRIFILEDEAPDLAHHERIVRDAVPGAEIVSADSLARGLQAVKQGRYDLAILDLDIQGDRAAGQTVLQALRAGAPTPVVVVSGLDVATYRPQMYTLEVWEYFEKPVDVSSLRLMIQRLLAPRPPLPGAQIIVGDLHWEDPGVQKPRWKGQVVSLAQSERITLRLLVQTPDQVVTYGELLDALETWTQDPALLRNALAKRISEIRTEFRSVDPEFENIMTVIGKGYMWRSTR